MARQRYAPDLLVVPVDPASGPAPALLRSLVDGKAVPAGARAAAYLCHRMTCSPPLPSAAELLEMSSAGVAVNGDPSVLAPREGSTSLCTGDGCLGDLRGLARNGRAGRQVEEGRPVEEVVLVVRPDPSGPITDPPPPGWDPRELTQALRRKMTAVQRCFEREITTGNPDAGGRPASADAVTKANSFTRRGLAPSISALVSLSRTAMSASPIGERTMRNSASCASTAIASVR